MKMNYKKLISCLVVTSCFFLLAFLFNSQQEPPKAAASVETRKVSLQKSGSHVPIAEIRVGQRVAVSTDKENQPTVVDSSTWKKVTLLAEDRWADGTLDTIHIESLVPPEWLDFHHVELGGLVPIPLDLVEMGLDDNLQAKVTAIERCPEIKSGAGRVVLTTVNHLNRDVCELAYSTSGGNRETIKTTGAHRFYSLDRNDWIHINNARQGERLQGLGDSVLTMVSCKPLNTTERVYNMTVEDDHVYHVGYLNLLAHNTGCFESRSSAFRQAKRDAGIPMGQQPLDVLPENLTYPGSGKDILGPNGLPVVTRNYYFKNHNGEIIVIQEHSLGHPNEPASHFNVRPIDDLRNGSVDGTQKHYIFPGKFPPFFE